MDKTLQDLVWSVLPKEFKEEVKKIYSALLADIRMYQGDNPEQVGTTDSILWERTLGIKSTLCRLFGEHNLTSDAEGEEMLTVSRKKVQSIYKESKHIVSNEVHGSKRYSMHIQTLCVLESLFGSKCLPDTSNVASNVPSTEPKPAEPKFNLGDIVRFKYCCATYRIDGLKMSDGVMLYQVGEVWAEESDLEPYTEPTNEDFVTLGVESAEYLRKSLEESEYRNSSQNIENCDKQFNNILKDCFSKERRLNIAAMMAQAILTRIDDTPQVIAEVAFRHADALIAESGKGDKK